MEKEKKNIQGLYQVNMSYI